MNPSSVDGLGITKTVPRVGETSHHGWGHKLQIGATRNRQQRYGNASGGINVGQVNILRLTSRGGRLTRHRALRGTALCTMLYCRMQKRECKRS